MNRIEADYSALLAARLYDDRVEPIAEARRAAGKHAFFAPWRDPKETSYFATPALASAGAADLDRPEMAGPDALIDALAARWAAEGESELAALAPRLKEIARALGEEQAEQGVEVDILCYTMF